MPVLWKTSTKAPYSSDSRLASTPSLIPAMIPAPWGKRMRFPLSLHILMKSVTWPWGSLPGSFGRTYKSLEKWQHCQLIKSDSAAK